MEWVKDKYYYIVYFKDFYNPKIFPVFFTSRASAKRAIAEKPKKNQKWYEVISGEKLRDFGFKYVLRLGKMSEFTKYKYPKDLDTVQKRKTYRTVMRRRLRRMGMLTPVKSKYSIGKPVIQGRLIKNRQVVADCPHTIAKAFTLERKRHLHYYVIISKHLSKKKSILFECRVLRINSKGLRVMSLNIKTQDIITPYLLTEVIDSYGKDKETIVDRLRREGIIKGNGIEEGIFKRMRNKPS